MVMGILMADAAKAILLSLSALAREFGCSRETLRKKFIAANVQPVTVTTLHPQLTIDGDADPNAGKSDLYALRDALRAWLTSNEAGFDPENLDPFRRVAHYKAGIERLKLDAATRELIPRIEVEQEQARILRSVALTLDTLPDVIERDCGATPNQVARIERAVDDLREALYVALVAPPPVNERLEQRVAAESP
jgi:uncharacterized protein DUF1441